MSYFDDDNLRYKVTTPPTVEPVSLTDMKLNMRVTCDADDNLITAYIAASRQWCEDYENRAYITQTITLKRDSFYGGIVLPKPNLQSVTTIKYIDQAGVNQTLDSSIYDVDIYSEPGIVTLAFGEQWPTIRGDHNGVEIIYVAGYGDASTDMPESTIQAIKLMCGHLYEHREGVSEMTLEEIPLGVKSLLNKRNMTV